MYRVEKMTISLPRELAKTLKEKIPSRKRSRFIAKIIDNSLKEIERDELREAYIEAYDEIKRENQKLQGTVGDGIS